MKARITFRKEKRNGRYRTHVLGMGLDLCVNGEPEIHIRPTENGWYWYGFGNNTLPNQTFKSLEVAREHALLFAKYKLASAADDKK